MRVEVTPVATTVETVAQRVILVDRAGKRALLADMLRDATIDRALVFTRTKHGADKVVRGAREGRASRAAAIHGNKSQSQRERALDGFRAGKIRMLVATDIAARGIDVDGISHVINYDLPNMPETTSTASAAPRAPAPTASRSRSATPRRARTCATSRS